MGEDGLNGLGKASRAALDAAETVFGGPRHLALAQVDARGCAWPVPFSLAPVLALRGRPVAVLTSGDPFWFGAGGSLSAELSPEEWCAYPAPSTFALAAARLGWRLEETICLGLHAAPFDRLVPVLAEKIRMICLLRDGAAPQALAGWLDARGFGPSRLWILQALGGPRERIVETTAEAFGTTVTEAPVAVAIEAAGAPGLPRTAGLPDALFASDGQITKSPVRALTLSALAPRPGELLWDIGAGSGSVSVEWALSARGCRALALEPQSARAANIAANAATFGLSHRIEIREGRAPEALSGLPAPDAVFVGGGASDPLLETLWDRLAPGTRLVVNAVTLETEALLLRRHAELGGRLLRLEISEAAPLGRMRGWSRARPITQWSVTR
ncbi:precorrin-6Y C5,15-methyltransferase (decarboxylating) [Celeribacter indicus]|nr:precorrin-6Y C5,15-methyltransferase (decarboxylating) [Celeribacter indicus]